MNLYKLREQRVSLQISKRGYFIIIFQSLIKINQERVIYKIQHKVWIISSNKFKIIKLKSGRKLISTGWINKAN